MSVIMKIVLCVGGVLVVIGSTFVTIAALFSPKEHRAEDRDVVDGDKWDESIEDV